MKAQWTSLAVIGLSTFSFFLSFFLPFFFDYATEIETLGIPLTDVGYVPILNV